jgi:hypothetical protein
MLFPKKKVKQFANGEFDLSNAERDHVRLTVRKILSWLRDEIVANKTRVASFESGDKVPKNIMARWDQMLEVLIYKD